MSHVFAENESSVAGFARRSDAFLWRFIGTAISFMVFGLSALVLSVTILPLLRLLPRAHCQRWSRLVLQRGMRTFLGLMRALGVLTCEMRGVERLGRPGQLIVANHPTLLDALFLIAHAPQAVCVAKQAMFRNLLTRTAVAVAGYISNALTADLIDRAGTALRQGQCVIMFPEATRTRVGAPLKFHRGAANIGVRAAAIVTPVYIRCEPITLTSEQPWYRIPSRRPHFSLVVGEDFSLTAYREMGSVPAASRAFNERMRDHFESELQRYGSTRGTDDHAYRR